MEARLVEEDSFDGSFSNRWDCETGKQGQEGGGQRSSGHLT